MFCPVSLHFAPFHYCKCHDGDATTPDRATTLEVAVTTDSSDHGTPPPQTYNDSNYHFNHSTPGNTVYYNPTTVMDQLHITEHQTITAPPLANNIPTRKFSLHVSTTLTTASYSTGTTGLHTTHSLHPWRSSDATLQFHTAQHFAT